MIAPVHSYPPSWGCFLLPWLKFLAIFISQLTSGSPAGCLDKNYEDAKKPSFDPLAFKSPSSPMSIYSCGYLLLGKSKALSSCSCIRASVSKTSAASDFYPSSCKRIASPVPTGHMFARWPYSPQFVQHKFDISMQISKRPVASRTNLAASEVWVKSLYPRAP